MYDITRRESFESLENWIKDTKAVDSNMVIMLIGNKSDLGYRRRVTREEGEEFAKRHNLLFLETSAKEDKGINDAFESTAKEIVNRIESGEIDGFDKGVMFNNNVVKDTIEKPRKCC